MVWQFFFPRHVRQLSTSDSGMKKESVNCVDPPEACIYFFLFFKKKRRDEKENVGRSDSASCGTHLESDAKRRMRRKREKGGGREGLKKESKRDGKGKEGGKCNVLCMCILEKKCLQSSPIFIFLSILFLSFILPFLA